MDPTDETPEEALLTPEEVAARYRGRIGLGTLRNWRSQGRGPPFLKIGRAILYRRIDLEAWEAAQTTGRP